MSIPATSISHGANLHYAIGALGHGRHSAHYADNQPGPGGEGTVRAINVTNTKGDGSVAHEWGHSLD
ncbi:MAG: hypothetical protein GTO41_12070, partial [Burkholderiales bacterium]|nr:hypothetical protein [Burkholderiales bacterium]